jgi:outer membrane receptor protein involved in Fe transport
MISYLQAGALDMSEIMARMRDQEQLHLQNAERDFCSTLNALAGGLLRRAVRLEAAAAAPSAAFGTAFGAAADAADNASVEKSKASKKKRKAVTAAIVADDVRLDRGEGGPSSDFPSGGVSVGDGSTTPLAEDPVGHGLGADSMSLNGPDN